MNTPIIDFIRNYIESGAVRMHMPGHKGRGPAAASALNPAAPAASALAETEPKAPAAPAASALNPAAPAASALAEAEPKALAAPATSPQASAAPATSPYAADITEIGAAHYMYEIFADEEGVVAQSEANASALFGCPTYYSTEGSSLCIRAMLYLCTTTQKSRHVLAARNVHQTFLSAAALLDLDVTWLWPSDDSLLSMDLDARAVDDALRKMPAKPCCVYLTSPDYLGHILPIREIADVCHAHGVPLVVDNAHGAYLRFLTPSRHPCDLGADLCCDSAHKTLPVLTGGAYLHVNPVCAAAKTPAPCVGVPADSAKTPAPCVGVPADSAKTPAPCGAGLSNLTHDQIRSAMGLFASTSPSWLILQSLDRANAILADEAYRTRFAETVRKTAVLKEELQNAGYSVFGEEPCKITILTGSRHLSGQELASALASCEAAEEERASAATPGAATPAAAPTNRVRADLAGGANSAPADQRTDDAAAPAATSADVDQRTADPAAPTTRTPAAPVAVPPPAEPAAVAVPPPAEPAAAPTDLPRAALSRPIEVEYADNDVVVLMPSTETTEEEWEILRRKLLAVPEGAGKNEQKRWHLRPARAMSVREAAMLPYEVVPLEKAEGRVAHMMPCSCPPCVPIVVCGEKIEADEITCLASFGYSYCKVVAP